MKKKPTLIFLIFLVFKSFTFLIAQETDIAGIDKDEFANSEIVRDETFNGTSLWGLINGGADVYLEYGFNGLRLQELIIGGSKFRIEIYKMNDSESAFGIYTMSCFKCKEKNKLFSLDCSNTYQFQTVRGDSYISIINETGSDKNQTLSKEIAKVIVNRIEDKPPEFPAIFKNEIFKPYYDKLKYFKGPLGLQNAYSSLSEAFEAFSGYRYYLLPFEDNVRVSIIDFATEIDCNNYLKELIIDYKEKNSGKTILEDGNVKIFSKKNNKSLTLLEYDKGNTSSDSFIKAVEKIISVRE